MMRTNDGKFLCNDNDNNVTKNSRFQIDREIDEKSDVANFRNTDNSRMKAQKNTSRLEKDIHSECQLSLKF